MPETVARFEFVVTRFPETIAICERAVAALDAPVLKVLQSIEVKAPLTVADDVVIPMVPAVFVIGAVTGMVEKAFPEILITPLFEETVTIPFPEIVLNTRLVPDLELNIAKPVPEVVAF